MKTAKVFKSGNSQAVRIPKEFHLDARPCALGRRAGSTTTSPPSIPAHDRDATGYEFGGVPADADACETRDGLRRDHGRTPTMIGMPVTSDRLELIAGRKVLVVEDGPTLTHGEMRFGAGTVLASTFGAAAIVDPRRASASQLGSRVARGASPFIGSHNSQSSQSASVTPRRVPGSRTQTNTSSG